MTPTTSTPLVSTSFKVASPRSSRAAANGTGPTPAISHAILTHNRGRSSGLADGVVVTPSHNPPEDGGFKYNPPNGGPADTDITEGQDVDLQLDRCREARPDIVVCGHYGCGGVLAAARGMRIGLADNWLRHVQDVRLRHRQRLNHLPQDLMEDTLCEMNVIEQVGNVAMSNVMQDAWGRGQKVAIHGWVYGVSDGLVKDLGVSMQGAQEVVDVFRNAIKRYPRMS